MHTRPSELTHDAARPTEPAADQDLGYFIRLLWGRRWWILGGALACAVLVTVSTLVKPRSYEATLSLGVSRPGQGDTQTAPLNPSNYRPVIANQGLATDVIQRLGLKDGDQPMSPQVFLDRVLSVEEVRGTSLLLIKVRYTDPQQAARIANVVAERAVEVLRKLSNDETLQVRSSLGSQLQDSRTRLEDARRALAAFRTTAQIELVRKDVEAVLAERAGLLKLAVNIGARRAELARAERELSSLARTNTLRRTVEQDPALAEAVRQQQPATSPLGLVLQYEDSNPVHQKMEERVTELRAELAGLERESAQLIDERHLAADQQARLTELYRKESELSRLELERDLAEKVFTQASTAYETARLQVASRGVLLQVVDQAQPPRAPLPRGAGRAGALALLLSAGVLSISFILLDAFRNALHPS